MGNSDHSNPQTREPATSLSAAAPLWRAFVRDYTRDWPVSDFRQPSGVVDARIDAWSGGRPGPWTRDTRSELFIDGTQPGAGNEVDRAGLLYRRACGGWRVDPLQAELGPEAWDADVQDWIRRARRGVGVEGEHGSRTAYFWGERSWGGPIIGPCPKPKSEPKPEKPKPEDPKPDDPKPPKDPDPGPPDPPDGDDLTSDETAALNETRGPGLLGPAGPSIAA
jgi:hypothetical protein